MKKLESVEEVVAAFSSKQVDRWIMVGYRAWYKRQCRVKVDGKIKAANKRLGEMTPAELEAYIEKVKKKL